MTQAPTEATGAAAVWTPGERQPVPDTRMARRMAAGHLARTGHPLRAELVATADAGIWRTERACCD